MVFLMEFLSLLVRILFLGLANLILAYDVLWDLHRARHLYYLLCLIELVLFLKKIRRRDTELSQNEAKQVFIFSIKIWRSCRIPRRFKLRQAASFTCSLDLFFIFWKRVEQWGISLKAFHTVFSCLFINVIELLHNKRTYLWHALFISSLVTV